MRSRGFVFAVGLGILGAMICALHADDPPEASALEAKLSVRVASDGIVPASVEFVRGADGKISGAIHHQNGITFPAPKLTEGK